MNKLRFTFFLLSTLLVCFSFFKWFNKKFAFFAFAPFAGKQDFRTGNAETNPSASFAEDNDSFFPGPLERENSEAGF